MLRHAHAFADRKCLDEVARPQQEEVLSKKGKLAGAPRVAIVTAFVTCS
jgi:hypothetical protein